MDYKSRYMKLMAYCFKNEVDGRRALCGVDALEQDVRNKLQEKSDSEAAEVRAKWNQEQKENADLAHQTRATIEAYYDPGHIMHDAAVEVFNRCNADYN